MSTLSVGLMNQLGDALEKAGYSPQEVNELKKRIKLLEQIKGVLAGMAQVVPVKYVIDLDADPYLAEGWEVVEHRKGGKFEFDSSKVRLCLLPSQQDDEVPFIEGTEIRRELAGKPVFNANLLDFYLAHTDLIPAEWEGKRVFFWGTIYREENHLGYGPKTQLVVCYLSQLIDGQWSRGSQNLVSNWANQTNCEPIGINPAAVRA